MAFRNIFLKIFAMSSLFAFAGSANSEELKPCYKNICVGSNFHETDKFWEQDEATKGFSFNEGDRNQCSAILKSGFTLPDDHPQFNESGATLGVVVHYVAETGEVLSVANIRVLPPVTQELPAGELLEALTGRYGEPTDTKMFSQQVMQRGGRIKFEESFAMKYEYPNGITTGIGLMIEDDEFHAIMYTSANSARGQEIVDKQKTCALFQE